MQLRRPESQRCEPRTRDGPSPCSSYFIINVVTEDAPVCRSLRRLSSLMRGGGQAVLQPTSMLLGVSCVLCYNVEVGYVSDFGAKPPSVEVTLLSHYCSTSPTGGQIVVASRSRLVVRALMHIGAQHRIIRLSDSRLCPVHPFSGFAKTR